MKKINIGNIPFANKKNWVLIKKSLIKNKTDKTEKTEKLILLKKLQNKKQKNHKLKRQ